MTYVVVGFEHCVAEIEMLEDMPCRQESHSEEERAHIRRNLNAELSDDGNGAPPAQPSARVMQLRGTRRTAVSATVMSAARAM